MWLKPIALDADMTVGAVLDRLAANGLWLDPRDSAASARIERISRDGQRSFDDAAAFLQAEISDFAVAIRRQWGTQILWYGAPVDAVLSMCRIADRGSRISDALRLNAPDGKPLPAGSGRETPFGARVELEGEVPTKVRFHEPVPDAPRPPGRYRGIDLGGIFGAIKPDVIEMKGHGPGLQLDALEVDTGPVQAWPRIDAPEEVVAEQEFDVVVGLSLSRQAGVDGAAMKLPFSSASPSLDLEIELSAGPQVRSLDGWSQTLRVEAGTVPTAEVKFRLIGNRPEDPQHPWLTTLDVRYLMKGMVCGLASRPLAILAEARAYVANAPAAQGLGTEWTRRPAIASPVQLEADPEPPDLTLELLRADGSEAAVALQCRLYSPHRLATPKGPFSIALPQDAKTFSKQIVDDVRLYSTGELLHTGLKGTARLIADVLPGEFFDALAEVAEITKPEPPSVLIVSADPYVPWELAWVEPPLNPDKPSVLGAQAVVGRWLRQTTSGSTRRAPRPPIHPPGSIDIKQFAVMAACYQVNAGLRRLPMAEAEAIALQASHECHAVPATTEQLRDLLAANLLAGDKRVAVDAVHIAGHGRYDPAVADSSALYLMDGKPVRSTLFAGADFGDGRHPLLFLNACTLGIGGENLGITAGFPGNSLRGGFGAMVGALWEIDDQVAHDIALEFWNRALPPGGSRGDPVGRILHDLRSLYQPDAQPAPVSTYLSYVYYGHPRLKLQRA